jgi:hypothetical protein
MARANLGQLLGNVGEKEAPKPTNVETDNAEAAAPAANPIKVRQARSSSPTPPASKKVSEPSEPAADSHAPTYLRYVRKETRLREDQQNRLTLEARRLNRAKKTKGARITENSLIRVAVDVLLAQIDRAAGDDEDAIRKSMSS